jgi:hypothetical protein
MSSTNLVVKMMSGEDLPDNDVSKGFTLVEAFGEVNENVATVLPFLIT